MRDKINASIKLPKKAQEELAKIQRTVIEEQEQQRLVLM